VPKCTYTRRIFTVWTRSTALRFTAAGAPLAARRIRILPWISMPDGRWSSEWSIYSSQITGGFENPALSTRRYFSQLNISLKIEYQSFLDFQHTRPSCMIFRKWERDCQVLRSFLLIMLGTESSGDDVDGVEWKWIIKWFQNLKHSKYWFLFVKVTVWNFWTDHNTKKRVK
jgi:hypothetical protein